MKQLIHSTGVHVVAALNESVFAILNSSSKDCAVISLIPTTETGGGDTSQGNPVPLPPRLRPSRPDGSAVLATSTSTAIASALSLDEKTLYCAVSRQDKTLVLYSIPLVQETIETADPCAVYKTQKRVGSLVFARVPSADASKEPLDVVIAGDFEGNATAYPVHCTDTQSATSRLLLGHTASMLTGVKLVQSSIDGKTRILTSDRDEKVRISSFPKTFVVEGYLLGHTAFVSSLDVAADEACPLCVTCGGDGTIRLWDYITCKELDVIQATTKSSDGNESDGGDKDDDDNEDEDDIEIPVSVAMNADGTIVAAVWHESNRVDIFAISSDKTLNKIQTFECSAQALVASFSAGSSLNLLAKDPTYLLQYGPIRDDAGKIASFELISLDNSPLCAALKDAGTKAKIEMASTTLEVDDLKKVELKSKQSIRDREWNNAERKEKAKARTARRKKRRREEKKAAAKEEENS